MIVLIAIVIAAAVLTIWFSAVHREMSSRAATVSRAEIQLTACRRNHLHTRGSTAEPATKTILTRSLDIYQQAVALYNQALLLPRNHVPAVLMGFRQIPPGESMSGAAPAARFAIRSFL